MVSTQKKKTTKKKPVKRKATKKKAVKKPSKKQVSAKVRKNAHPDRVFVMVNGKKLKNVKQLADVMGEIEDYVFHHHVTPDKNDFAAWLEHVFEDINLAKQVSGAKDKKHVQLVIYRHISHKLW